MSNVFEFDSSSWESIRNAIKCVNEENSIIVGTTEEGETIIYGVVTTEEGSDILQTDVYQKNGWIRTNYYDPHEHTIEELYKRGEEPLFG